MLRQVSRFLGRRPVRAQHESARGRCHASDRQEWSTDYDGNDGGGSNGDAGSGGSGIRFEVGEIDIDHHWQRVDFDNAFVDPVVVMKPLGGTDDEPAVIRIDAVEPTGFMVRVQEWDHLDGVHALEKASYIVMERGTHQLPDGSWVEASVWFVPVGSRVRPATRQAPPAHVVRAPPDPGGPRLHLRHCVLND